MTIHRNQNILGLDIRHWNVRRKFLPVNSFNLINIIITVVKRIEKCLYPVMDIWAALVTLPLVTFFKYIDFGVFSRSSDVWAGAPQKSHMGSWMGISQRYTYEPHWACARNPRTYGPHLTHPLISGSQIQHLKSSGQIQHLKSSGEVCLKYS